MSPSRWKCAHPYSPVSKLCWTNKAFAGPVHWNDSSKIFRTLVFSSLKSSESSVPSSLHGAKNAIAPASSPSVKICSLHKPLLLFPSQNPCSSGRFAPCLHEIHPISKNPWSTTWSSFYCVLSTGCEIKCYFMGRIEFAFPPTHTLQISVIGKMNSIMIRLLTSPHPQLPFRNSRNAGKQKFNPRFARFLQLLLQVLFTFNGHLQ